MQTKVVMTELTDEQVCMLAEDYRRGATYGALQEAYGIDRKTLHRYLRYVIGYDRERHLPDTYEIDEDLSLWLREQPNIGKVLNEALRLYKNRAEVYQIETK